MTKTAQRNERYNQYVSDASARRVWRAVTKTPCATTREIGAVVGLGHSSVSAALRILKDAGYIDFAPGTAGARTILVPFAEVRQNDAAIRPL